MNNDRVNENNEIELRKKKLRENLLTRQRSLSTEYKRYASEKIAGIVLKNSDYLKSGIIFIYSGMKNEVDTSIIISDALLRGKKVAVPKVISSRHMEALRIKSMDDLRPGKYGILEPKEGSEVIEPEDIELVFVPCVSFSKDGYRLGYGGGFYDTYLAEGNFKKIIIAFDRMKNEDIPTDSHDQKAEGIITEEGYYDINKTY